MRYGFCTCFATPQKDAIDYDLLRRISAAGFDDVEFPLCLIAGLSDGAFAALKGMLTVLSLKATVCTHFFPDDMPLTGPQQDRKALEGYLTHALDRAAQLGIRKVVFASLPAWQIPVGFSRQEGYDRLAALLNELLIPSCVQYDMLILIEPLRKAVCNLINTLTDGMALVNRVNSPAVRLVADGFHIISNGEDTRQISDYARSIEHVHLAEAARALPVRGYSKELESVLAHLQAIGYDKTISFETVGGEDEEGMKAALALLKSRFENRSAHLCAASRD
jgi:D-psicose/D-tagatose/L-ribulose 3-epimerase